MAYPVTLIHGVLPGWRDFERDGSAESEGINTCHLADFGVPYDLARYQAARTGSGGNLTAGAQEVVRLQAEAIPVPYDDAGVTYPAGSLLLVGGQYRTEAGTIVSNNGTLSPASGLISVVSLKSFYGVWLCIRGIPAATTGTVSISRTATWGFVGPPTVVLSSYSIDGANGSEQWFMLDTHSNDADACPSTSFFYEHSWTGTAPVQEILFPPAQAIDNGRICPSELPVGYTQVTDPQEQNFGSPHWQPNTRWRAYRFSCPSLSPLNRGFTRRLALALGPVVLPITQGVARRFGQPEAPCDSTEVTNSGSNSNLAYPCIWVGDLLYELSQQPRCPVQQCWSISTGTSSNGVAYPTSTISTSWSQIDISNGWRNISVWAYDATTSGSITVDGIDIELGHVTGWGTGVPTNIDGTITFTQAEAATVGSYGSTVKRLGAAITPPSNVPNAVLYGRMTLRFTRPSDNGSFNTATATIVASRRVDIPPAWPAAGPGGVISGGYDPALIANPTNRAFVTDAAAGVTSITFTHTVGLAENYVGSFLPATDGVWSTRASYATTTAFTSGEYEQITTRRTSHLGRAGKRFYGGIDSTTGGASFTLDLVNVAQVTTAVPSGAGGLTLTTAHRTDANWIFLTIAAPAAGTYRINLNASFNAASNLAGPTLFMGASLTDPYVIAPTRFRTREWYPIGALTAVITSTPPGAPADASRYIVGDSATGLWEGEDGNLARWDAPTGKWQFVRPDYTRYGAVASVGATRYWRNAGATAWSTGAGDLLYIDIPIPESGTIYVRIGKDDPDGVTSSDSILVDLLTPVVTWATV